MAEKPNILILMSDQHRADVMGCAGNPVVATPHLDQLANEGVRFDRAYCQGPLCMPSRASFLTERYVRDHGVSENNWDTPHHLPTFPQALRDAGYHTSCIGKMHLYVHGGGERRTRDTRERVDDLRAYGFEEPIEAVGKHAAASIRSEYTDELERRGLYSQYREWMMLHRYGRGQIEVNGKLVDRLPMYHTASTPLPGDAYLDNWIGQRAVEWIERYDRQEPFLQWVGFAGPHDPWDAPREYVDRYAATDMPLGCLAPPEPGDPGPLQAFIRAFQEFGGSEGLTDDVIREIRRFYYANVTLIDEQIGAILAALERRGMLENTWVIYTTDHGEMLGDHRMLTKMVFYEPSVRVPLLIRPPGGRPALATGALVEQVDVPATLRAIAGAGDVAGSEGRSLLPYFEAAPPERGRDVVHSENYGFALFETERYKLLVFEATGQPVQLFDLESDPCEDVNLVAHPAAQGVLAELMQRYAEPFLEMPPVRLGPGRFSR